MALALVQREVAKDMMGKLVPVWLVLLIVLLGGLSAVLFGWVVMSTVTGTHRPGQFAMASVTIASLPDQITRAYKALTWQPEEFFRVSRPNLDLSDFLPVRMRQNIGVTGLLVRADKGALDRARGWRVLVGTVQIDGELTQAAVVFSPELEIVKTWKLSDGIRDQGASHKVTDKILDGFALLPDGSVIGTFTSGTSIQRFDECGNRLWSTPGEFNHSVTLDSNGEHAWTIAGYDQTTEVVRLATATGRVVQRIAMADIIKANPAIDILEISQQDSTDARLNVRQPGDVLWAGDPFHINDVEPLSEITAARFVGFRGDDLLLSSRSLNLIFVVDPKTLLVRWWHVGAWRRQHDPDWQPTGEITVYDNRMGREYSRIVAIDPVSKTTRVVLDGRVLDFYSRLAGKHQVTESGNLLVSSPFQGRVFELDSDGHLVLDMLNTKSGANEFDYFVSEIRWLPLEFFDFSKERVCEG